MVPPLFLENAFETYIYIEVQMHCNKCQKEIIGKSAGAHARFCGIKKDLQKKCKICGKTFESLDKRKTLCSKDCRNANTKLVLSNEDIKHRISNKRKEFLKNNPDKHPWKNKEKFKSQPCQILKDLLSSNNVLFEEEFNPLEDRFFSIDIAFPSLKIGLEINGEQHYNRNGTLKKYYQERHDLIEATGWSLFEIHYSICYDKNKLNDIINNLIKKHNLQNVDLSFTKIEKKKEKKKEKKEINFDCWEKAIKEIDCTKRGFISALSKKMNVSHTHARRILNKHFQNFV